MLHAAGNLLTPVVQRCSGNPSLVSVDVLVHAVSIEKQNVVFTVRKNSDLLVDFKLPLPTVIIQTK